MRAEDLLRLRKEAEELFEKEYRRAADRLRERVSDPRERLRIARKVARRRVNEWLERNHNLTMEKLEAKIAALESDVKLEELAA